MTNSTLREPSLTSAAETPAPWPWPYLYLTIAGAALAVAAPGQAGDFWDAVIAFAVVWVTAGLLIEAAEIWQAFRQRHDLAADERSAGRFETCWRLAVALLLPAYYLQRDPDQFLMRDGSIVARSFSAKVLFVLFAVALITALSSNARLMGRPTRRAWSSKTIEFSIWLGAAALALVTAWRFLAPGSLDQLAMRVLDLRRPEDVFENDRNLALRQSQFLLRGVVTGSAGALAIFLARQFGKKSPATGRQMAIHGCLTVGVLGVAVYSLYSLAQEGGAQASNAIAEAEASWPLSTWRVLAGLLVFATTAMAWRFTAQARADSAEKPVEWRKHPQYYYHESRWLAAILFVAGLGQLWEMLSSTQASLLAPSEERLAEIQRYGQALAECFRQPVAILLAAQSAVALRGAVGRRTPEEASRGASFRNLPALRFAVVWLTLLATLTIGAAALAWVGFSLWHSSWEVVKPPGT
ncbi:MAG TPA: hypothetical protein VGJ26_16380 [Pirellulales bacterium]|jgi:hypothetical protein